MPKRVKVIIVTCTLVTFIGLLLFVLRTGATFTPQPCSSLDFSQIIGENVCPNVRVVDIAMLGAHNAFSDRIHPGSAVCPQDTHVLTSPAVGAIAPGVLSRFLQCQKSDATGLLTRGVRYFDVRLTYANGNWYTHHRLISASLEGYLVQIIDFLANNPGEIIVFDIQHAHLGAASFDDLWGFIANVTSNGYSLFDFVTFDPYNSPLGELTKGQATAEGAAVIILAKTPMFEGGFHYNYYRSIRSTWHDQIRTNELVAGIQREYAYLNQRPGVARDMFRVNQGQTTPNFSGFSNVVYTFFTWSILSHNGNHNVALLNHENFLDWLSVMPIFMVDFSDSPVGNFNVYVVDAINEFNRSLSGW